MIEYFKKGDDVPHHVQHVNDDSHPMEYLRFGVDCTVERIDGVSHVWPTKPLKDGEYLIVGKPAFDGAKISLSGGPTHFYTDHRNQ